MASRKDRIRLLVALVATAVIVGPLVYLWLNSRMPGSYSVMEMGYVDYGGGLHDMAGSMPGMHHGTSVADLTVGTARKADVVVDLAARKERFALASGRKVDGYTFNGQSPGPPIRATVGQLVEVHVRNESVPDGITVHWHGVDVPNAEDGVAGVTQNAIERGGELTYRFVADQVGTYWYHSHQVSHTQVQRGLLGPLVVLPKSGSDGVDETVLAHTYAGVKTLNGREDTLHVEADAGETARLRVINTDNGPVQVWAGSMYQVLAIDGYDLNKPTPVDNQRLDVPAGGRADLEVTAPARVQVGGSAIVVGPAGPEDPGPDNPGEPEKPVQPKEQLDLLGYGSPAPIPFDTGRPDRRFRYSIGRRPGFVDGRPGVWWSINGHLWPDVPMFLVDEGDVVVFHIENHSGDIHPMHLHGHHAVVMARDGKKASGSPWWVDSLEVRNGESFDIAFLADNPGIWMDHCHNLKHAAQGLVAHLMYSGVGAAYQLGDDSGNEPE